MAIGKQLLKMLGPVLALVAGFLLAYYGQRSEHDAVLLALHTEISEKCLSDFEVKKVNLDYVGHGVATGTIGLKFKDGAERTASIRVAYSIHKAAYIRTVDIEVASRGNEPLPIAANRRVDEVARLYSGKVSSAQHSLTVFSFGGYRSMERRDHFSVKYELANFQRGNRSSQSTQVDKFVAVRTVAGNEWGEPSLLEVDGFDQ